MLNLRAEQRPPHTPGTAVDAGDSDGGHRTSIVERGSFAVARCTCGWKGPARRARDRARRDADEHTAD